MINDLYAGGSGNTFSAGLSNYTWGIYDFGATNLRWLLVAAGSGIYASTDMGVTFAVAATSRTSSWQSFERSKNIVVATSYAQNVPLYWAGSGSTYFVTLAPGSAPSAKYARNFNGFLLLMNYKKADGTLRKRGVAYADENTQITDSWVNEFDLPSSADDEITGSFVINRVFYISTRYTIYRVSYVGGNPDWEYQKIRSWGYVPNTMKVGSLEGMDVVVGLDWSRRIKVFDGTSDIIISDNIESDNNICEFSLSKLSYAGSGLVICNAELDTQEQEYRLNVAIGPNSSQTTHAILFNLRSKALYPYSNQQFQAMCMSESSNRQFLLACDRSGYVHVLNTSNLDNTVPIDEYYDSPYLYKIDPGIVQKGANLELYFYPDSANKIYLQDRADFNSVWSEQVIEIPITSTNSVNQVVWSHDVKSVHNQYQYHLTSSSGTANPWRLTHVEFYFKDRGWGKGN